MDDKSLMILQKIAAALENKQMPIDTFPENDILDMINTSYLEQREREDHIHTKSMANLKYLFSELTTNGDTQALANLLYTLSSDSLDRQKDIIDPAIIMRCQENCRKIYQKYYSNNDNNTYQTKFSGKGVIYTAITGNYDTLLEPEVIDSNFDYICFTDNPNLESSVWEFRLIDNFEQLDNVRLARKHKILCHEFLSEYDYSIYVDGKIKIIGNLGEYVQKYSKNCDMLCFPHFVRDCAYQEAIACAQYQKDNDQLIIKQMERYANEGYPANNGMVDTACLVRSHKSIELQRVLSTWWHEVKTNSRRDQLSIGYAFWKNNAAYDICDLFVYKNPYICKCRDRETPY